jgi:catechol 2,3-dioxygenase-like lactoylglutathione lyase family enzyme
MPAEEPMAHPNPSILSHVSLGTNDFARAVAFYDRVLPTLGFWVQTPIDGRPASVGNGTHFGFVAPDKAAVHAFYEAALSAGARGDGEPGPRPEYGEPYYGCFVRDPDGHKIEAAFWDLQLVQKLYLDKAQA